jgi:hypothetical protein
MVSNVIIGVQQFLHSTLLEPLEQIRTDQHRPVHTPSTLNEWVTKPYESINSILNQYVGLVHKCGEREFEGEEDKIHEKKRKLNPLSSQTLNHFIQ